MLQLVDHAHTSSAVTFVEFVVDVLLRRGLVSRLLNYLAPWFLQEGLGLITCELQKRASPRLKSAYSLN